MKNSNMIRKTIDFTPEQIALLEMICEEQNCPNLISTVRFLIGYYEKNKVLNNEIRHNLKLSKRYLNELRRNEFMVLDLLNAMCIVLNISSVPSHADSQNHGTALTDAMENLRQYMRDIFTRNRTGDRDFAEGFQEGDRL